jgi:hypothetical protein
MKKTVIMVIAIIIVVVAAYMVYQSKLLKEKATKNNKETEGNPEIITFNGLENNGPSLYHATIDIQNPGNWLVSAEIQIEAMPGVQYIGTKFIDGKKLNTYRIRGDIFNNYQDNPSIEIKFY